VNSIEAGIIVSPGSKYGIIELLRYPFVSSFAFTSNKSIFKPLKDISAHLSKLPATLQPILIDAKMYVGEVMYTILQTPLLSIQTGQYG